MENEISSNSDTQTISGKFHFKFGDEKSGVLTAKIELCDMTPQMVSRIQSLTKNMEQEILYGIALHAVNDRVTHQI